MGMTGRCLCGEVSYEVSGDPITCVTCHCKNCQRQAGSALSIIVGVPEDAVTVSGELKTYNDTGDSGAVVQRQFCPNCGSPIFSRLAPQGAPLFIKAGTLDDTSALQPVLHCYTKSAQSWVEMGDLPQFETVPEGM